MTTDMLPPEPKKSSVWMWVGLGCGGVLLLCVVVVAAVGYFIYGRVKGFEQQFKDPAVREQRVKELLGAQEIPEGYHAFMTFSVPWVLDVAILTDREFVKMPKGSRSSPFDEWGFVYVQMPYKHRDEKWEDFLDGKRSPDELLQGREMHFRPKDTVGRGTVQGEGGARYRYVATRGEVEMGREVKEGITTVIGVECPNDKKFRMGIWFGPDPTAQPGDGATAPAPPEADKPEGAGAAFAGSPADEAAIKEFMAHFTLCQP